MYPPVDPVIFEFGQFALRWYGLLIMSAIFVGSNLASRYVALKGQDSNDFWDMIVWVLIPALMGARLYYVFIQSPRDATGIGYYLANPIEIFQVWLGGIHIFGAFMFGTLALWIYARIRKLPLLIFLDAICLALPLAQAIGRWGNFINQELYGPPTTLPWGLKIDPSHRIPPYNDLIAYPESVQFHPLFLYESIWNLCGFILIFWISKRFEKKLHNGDITLLYLIWYPLGRFFIEFLRTDSWFFAETPFNVVHAICGFSFLASIAALWLRHHHFNNLSVDH